MRRIIASLLLLSPLAAQAADVTDPTALRPVAQVALLPAPETIDPALSSFVEALWGRYWRSSDPQAFGQSALRVGRMDLNDDGQAELFLMIDAPDWESGQGYPMVIANWTKDGWNAIGWSWGDEDTVFLSDEVRDGWRSIRTGPQLLRWDQGVYAPTDLPKP